MNWITKMTRAMIETLELSGRARVLVQLRELDDEFLRRHGYAPEKLARGVAAWPWRLDAEPVARAPALETRPAKPARAAAAELTEAA